MESRVEKREKAREKTERARVKKELERDKLNGKGGFRVGAGRPKGSHGLLTRSLRSKIKAGRLIKFLQALADGDIEGSTVTERKDAASILLRKVMPDVNKTEIESGVTFKPVEIAIKGDRAPAEVKAVQNAEQGKAPAPAGVQAPDQDAAPAPVNPEVLN